MTSQEIQELIGIFSKSYSNEDIFAIGRWIGIEKREYFGYGMNAMQLAEAFISRVIQKEKGEDLLEFISQNEEYRRNSYKNLVEKKKETSLKIPRIITESPAGVMTKNFLREQDVNDLCEELKDSEKHILLNGFGGIGKTTVAKVLFHRLKKEYEHLAWITYNGSLQESILNQFEIFKEEKDREKRWEKIYKFLHNDHRKIIFVDDVDKTTSEDVGLRKITGMGISVVLVSRIADMEPYETHRIGFLDEEKCIQIFYNYCVD